MIVKICGITSLEDALRSVEAGADILGFNFYPGSSRFIEKEKVREIQDGLKDREVKVQTAGIFVNMPLDPIREIHAACDLDWIQLSRAESAAEIGSLDRDLIISIRQPSFEATIREIEEYSTGNSPRLFLVDKYHPGKYGGTGEVGDWALAQRVAERYPILLGGGLSPENVAEAVETVRPWGVDVASGVESSPGVKDPDRIRQFIRAAKGLGNN